jgi:dTDP-3-amino-3,4,6-trideoxy-alpha-D-glucose transaminase
MFDLRPVLAAAGSGIDAYLEQMHGDRQYILGRQTAAFESELAESFGGAAAVGVGSGTSALELCLRDAGITRQQQEVILPSMTSLFTAQAVLAAGARIRIADVDPHTLLLDAERAADAWTPQTAAVIAVHLYGQPCRLQELAGLCRQRGAVLIQDACQAHGARLGGNALTGYSPYTAYSFYPTKNLGALGDGGAIVTSDLEIADRLRMLRDGGRRGDQLCRAPAVNSRLDEIHSCYLRALLPNLAGWNEKRRRLAELYQENLQGLTRVRLAGWDGDSVHHLFVVRVHDRDRVRAALLKAGIQTGIHYPVAVHQQPGLLNASSWRFRPVEAELAAQEVLSLPIGPHVTEQDVLRIVSILRSTCQ